MPTSKYVAIAIKKRVLKSPMWRFNRLCPSSVSCFLATVQGVGIVFCFIRYRYSFGGMKERTGLTSSWIDDRALLI